MIQSPLLAVIGPSRVLILIWSWLGMWLSKVSPMNSSHSLPLVSKPRYCTASISTGFFRYLGISAAAGPPHGRRSSHARAASRACRAGRRDGRSLGATRASGQAWRSGHWQEWIQSCLENTRNSGVRICTLGETEVLVHQDGVGLHRPVGVRVGADLATGARLRVPDDNQAQPEILGLGQEVLEHR